MRFPSITPDRTVGLFFAVILLVLVFYAFFWESKVEPLGEPPKNSTCKGKPIFVDYPFHGGMIDPHACKPQCKEQLRKYIYYSNDRATQCSKLPGCLDWGEDKGVTCNIPEGVKRP